MTLPLLVLAAGTLVLGFIGLPHLAQVPHGYQGLLGTWLHPALVERLADQASPAQLVQQGYAVAGEHMAPSMLLGLMGAALGIGLLGIGIAWFLYKDGPSPQVERWTEHSGAGVYQAAYHKFYVDEIYDWILVKPFRWLARGLFEFVDKFVIDFLLVNGSAFVVDQFGRLARWLQNGMVQRYLAGLLVGGAVIVVLISRPSVEMKVQVQNQGVAPLAAEMNKAASAAGGDLDRRRQAALAVLADKGINPYTLQLEGNAGAGPGTAGAKVKWYLDGQLIGDKPQLTYQVQQGGAYQVTVEVTDGVFERTARRSTTVVVPDVLELIDRYTAVEVPPGEQDVPREQEVRP
jgi:hypothetical protein